MTIYICGGDARQTYAAQELTRLGYSVCNFPFTASDPPVSDLGGADILLLPIPATRDGIHLNCPSPTSPTLLSLAETAPAQIMGGGFSAAFVAEMRRSGRTVTDLLACPPFTEQNAALTAEAAVGVGMQAAGRSLKNLTVAVIGYGRIASRLTRYLLALGARVQVYARRETARLEATLDGAVAHDTSALPRGLGDIRLIFNTVPAPLLTREVTSHLVDCAVVELASGRENIALAAREDVTLHFANSLPGKIFPVSAGHIIAHTVDHMIQAGGDRV